MTAARIGRRLLLAAVTSLVAVCVGPIANAVADSTNVRIASPLDGSTINNPTPVFTGAGFILDEEELEELGLEQEVTLRIYEGATTVGPQVHDPMSTGASLGGTWSIGPVEALSPGVYTAQAEQFGEESKPVTFTVDTTPPAVTLTSPANGSSTSSGTEPVGGAAGTAMGDASAIAIQLFAGDTISAQAPLETLVVQASNGSWSATFGGLGPGTYTAQAAQRDQAGNTGTSGPVSFIVTAPPAPPPPVASFEWFPQTPTTGESVSLVSSSTDIDSPITAFAWALSSNGAFAAGKPVLTTSFATPGGHVVRLRVTDAAGRSSIATETVPVTARPRVLMQPFPVVRIAGSVTPKGARVTLLTVQTPVGARVTVACHGPGCKTKSESRLATVSSKSKSKSGAGVVLLSFHRFERPLRAGVILKVLVSKSGEIGKYTSFVIRRHKLPVRTDACLASASSKPTPCPTS